MSYQVFTRNWWKLNPEWPRGIEPDGGARKSNLQKVATEREARAICADWNMTHRPGKLSRKAEYEEL
jgi:hypothetical protein